MEGKLEEGFHLESMFFTLNMPSEAFIFSTGIDCYKFGDQM